MSRFYVRIYATEEQKKEALERSQFKTQYSIRKNTESLDYGILAQIIVRDYLKAKDSTKIEDLGGTDIIWNGNKIDVKSRSLNDERTPLNHYTCVEVAEHQGKKNNEFFIGCCHDKKTFLYTIIGIISVKSYWNNARLTWPSEEKRPGYNDMKERYYRVRVDRLSPII